MSTKNGFNLRAIGEYNDISETLKEKVAPLVKGQPVVYRLPVPIHQDNIMDGDGTKFLKNRVTKGYTFPESVLIPTIDEIQDEDGALKKIAVVRSYDAKTDTIVTHPLIIPGQNNGFFMVHPGNVASERFYAYLELTDFNGSKEGRDTSKEIMFYRVDKEAEGAKLAKKIDLLTEELIYVKDMDKEEVIQFAGALQWDTTLSPNVLKDSLKAYVHKNPGELHNMFKNKPLVANKSLIKQAIENSVIVCDLLQNKYIFLKTGQTIATFERIDGVELVDQFAGWLQTHKDGEKTKESIKKFLKQPAPAVT